MRKKILIIGGGIAGPTLAYWLDKEKFEVTILERAPALRLGGQNIDISDAAVDIVKMMGLEPRIRAHNTTELGLRFVDSEGGTVGEFPKGGKNSFTSEYEILRGDLGQIFFDATQAQTRYIFGDSVAALEQKSDHVEVRLASGKSEKYDLLVAADGVGSETRAMIVNEPDPYKYLGVFTSYMTIPREAGDSHWAEWFNAVDSRVILMRPDNKGTTRVSVNYWSGDPPGLRRTREESYAKLREVLVGAGWQAERISRELVNDPDLYLGPVSQVRLSRWSQGRCALVGDAAYCPTPFTGMGTTLAIIGAYVLAGELSSKEDHTHAFQAYEDRMKPFVKDVQKILPGFIKFVYPKSRGGVKLVNGLARFVASKPVQKVFGQLQARFGDEKNEFELPKY